MLSHSPPALAFARKRGGSASSSELSSCLFVVFSDLCGSDSAFIPDSFKRGPPLFSALVTVALNKVIGPSVFVFALLEILLFPCSFGFPEFLTGRAISAIKLTMQMTAVRFISFRKTTLKCLTFAFLNEHPPHASGLK
jgi:hypothetical protein